MAYFTTETLDFLQDLEIHNERDWFNDNKQRYLNDVVAPMIAFIIDVEAPLHKKVSKHFVADPKTNGGSMFRIYRDTRFAKDKTPYKTNTGAQFRHAAGKDVHAPGLYLHVEPGNGFMGSGIWGPSTKDLTRLRTAMVDDPKAFNRAHNAKWVEAGGWAANTDMLKRAPKGWPADHPMIEDLRRKHFTFGREITEAELLSPDLVDLYVSRIAETKPLLRWLCRTLGLDF